MCLRISEPSHNCVARVPQSLLLLLWTVLNLYTHDKEINFMLYLILLEQVSSTSSLFPQKSSLIRPVAFSFSWSMQWVQTKARRAPVQSKEVSMLWANCHTFPFFIKVPCPQEYQFTFWRNGFSRYFQTFKMEFDISLAWSNGDVFFEKGIFWWQSTVCGFSSAYRAFERPRCSRWHVRNFSTLVNSNPI